MIGVGYEQWTRVHDLLSEFAINQDLGNDKLPASTHAVRYHEFAQAQFPCPSIEDDEGAERGSRCRLLLQPPTSSSGSRMALMAGEKRGVDPDLEAHDMGYLYVVGSGRS